MRTKKQVGRDIFILEKRLEAARAELVYVLAQETLEASVANAKRYKETYGVDDE